MNRLKILRDHDFRFWQMDAEAEHMIFWIATGSAQNPDGDERRIHPDDWPLFKENIALLKRGATLNVPMRLLNDGKWVWFSFRMKKKLRYPHFIGIMVPLADEMERQNEIVELSQTKEKVYRALGHDLKGQFSSLLGFSDILVNSYEELDEISRLKYIGYMKTIASNTHLLVDNMLNWAKIRQGQIAIDKKPVLLLDKLDEVLGYIQFSLQSKQISLKMSFKKGLYVQADSVLLTSVLLNLITNAAKFSEEGQEVVVKAVEKPGQTIIQIMDQGIGIAPDLISKIFDPDTLHSKKGTKNESGTGLGLKISKEFVLLMGGKMNIQSKVGKGTKISLSLPLE